MTFLIRAWARLRGKVVAKAPTLTSGAELWVIGTQEQVDEALAFFVFEVEPAD